MPQASKNQLKDGNLGDISEERVFTKQDNMPSHSSRFTVLCAQQINKQEAKTHADNLQRIHDVPDGYCAGVTQVSRNKRVRVPDDIVDLLDGDVPNNHTK